MAQHELTDDKVNPEETELLKRALEALRPEGVTTYKELAVYLKQHPGSSLAQIVNEREHSDGFVDGLGPNAASDDEIDRWFFET